MNHGIQNKVLPILIAVLLLGTGVWNLLTPQQTYSQSERKVLTTRPEISAENILSGKFQKEFEAYAADQFVQRDSYRTMQAVFSRDILLKKDKDGVYLADGHLSKMEYPMRETMLDNCVQRFADIYEQYLQPVGITPYLVMVPDKNYFLAEESGHLSMDYGMLMEYVSENADFMHTIDVSGLLETDDYYRTDTHWRQEKIVDVAEAIADEMGADISADYQTQELDAPFYGVYYGQAALPVAPDTICYLTNEEIAQCTVTNYDTGTGRDAFVYDIDKAKDRDAYELFLEGATPLITIENPQAVTDRELIIFRDSFGSSIAPLFIHGYKKITLVDTRYIQSSLLGNFVSFENADVLFLYSTLLLNNSLALK